MNEIEKICKLAYTHFSLNNNIYNYIGGFKINNNRYLLLYLWGTEKITYIFDYIDSNIIYRFSPMFEEYLSNIEKYSDEQA